MEQAEAKWNPQTVNDDLDTPMYQDLETKMDYLNISNIIVTSEKKVTWGTPLYCAARWDCASVMTVDSESTPLHLGTEFRDPNPLDTTLARKNPEFIKISVENGTSADAGDDSGFSLLHRAAKEGENLQLIRILLENGADVNAADNLQKTPLHHAAFHRYIKNVKMLLEHGASVTAIDVDKRTPLFMSRTAEITQLLLKHGASVTAADKDGQTPLHYAAEWSRPESIQILIENHAPLNAVDKRGRTPLHYAAKFFNSRCIKLLIDKGASLNVQDRRGRTPLHYAARHGWQEEITLMINHKADVAAIDFEGNTPLHEAAKGYGFTETFRCLLAHGAALDAANNTLHAIIRKNRFKHVCNMLASMGASVTVDWKGKRMELVHFGTDTEDFSSDESNSEAS